MCFSGSLSSEQTFRLYRGFLELVEANEASRKGAVKPTSPVSSPPSRRRVERPNCEVSSGIVAAVGQRQSLLNEAPLSSRSALSNTSSIISPLTGTVLAPRGATEDVASPRAGKYMSSSSYSNGLTAESYNRASSSSYASRLSGQTPSSVERPNCEVSSGVVAVVGQRQSLLNEAPLSSRSALSNTSSIISPLTGTVLAPRGATEDVASPRAGKYMSLPSYSNGLTTESSSYASRLAPSSSSLFSRFDNANDSLAPRVVNGSGGGTSVYRDRSCDAASSSYRARCRSDDSSSPAAQLQSLRDSYTSTMWNDSSRLSGGWSGVDGPSSLTPYDADPTMDLLTGTAPASSRYERVMSARSRPTIRRGDVTRDGVTSASRSSITSPVAAARLAVNDLSDVLLSSAVEHSSPERSAPITVSSRAERMKSYAIGTTARTDYHDKAPNAELTAVSPHRLATVDSVVTQLSETTQLPSTQHDTSATQTVSERSSPGTAKLVSGTENPSRTDVSQAPILHQSDISRDAVIHPAANSSETVTANSGEKSPEEFSENRLHSVTTSVVPGFKYTEKDKGRFATPVNSLKTETFEEKSTVSPETDGSRKTDGIAESSSVISGYTNTQNKKGRLATPTNGLKTETFKHQSEVSSDRYRSRKTDAEDIAGSSLSAATLNRLQAAAAAAADAVVSVAARGKVETTHETAETAPATVKETSLSSLSSSENSTTTIGDRGCNDTSVDVTEALPTSPLSTSSRARSRTPSTMQEMLLPSAGQKNAKSPSTANRTKDAARPVRPGSNIAPSSSSSKTSVDLASKPSSAKGSSAVKSRAKTLADVHEMLVPTPTSSSHNNGDGRTDTEPACVSPTSGSATTSASQVRTPSTTNTAEKKSGNSTSANRGSQPARTPAASRSGATTPDRTSGSEAHPLAASSLSLRQTPSTPASKTIHPVKGKNVTPTSSSTTTSANRARTSSTSSLTEKKSRNATPTKPIKPTTTATAKQTSEAASKTSMTVDENDWKTALEDIIQASDDVAIQLSPSMSSLQSEPAAVPASRTRRKSASEGLSSLMRPTASSMARRGSTSDTRQSSHGYAAATSSSASKAMSRTISSPTLRAGMSFSLPRSAAASGTSSGRSTPTGTRPSSGMEGFSSLMRPTASSMARGGSTDSKPSSGGAGRAGYAAPTSSSASKSGTASGRTTPNGPRRTPDPAASPATGCSARTTNPPSTTARTPRTANSAQRGAAATATRATVGSRSRDSSTGSNTAANDTRRHRVL